MNDIEIRALYRDLMEPAPDPETNNRQRKLAAEAIGALFQQMESLREENRRIAGEVVKIKRMDGVLGDTYDLDRLRELVEADKKSRARKCPKCGRIKLYPRIDWKYFYCYSCGTTFPAKEIVRQKAVLAKEVERK